MMSQFAHRKRQALLLAICVICAHVTSGTLYSQGFRDNPVFRESVTLDLNNQAIKTMQSARDLLAERQWDQAIPILQQLIDNHGDSLLAVETGRYWNVADMCHWLISGLPNEFLVPYRQRVDGQANEWLELALESNDDRLLKQIIRRSFCSSAGDDALWTLGEIAFERGQYAVARQSWERLVPAFLPAADAEKQDAQKARHLVYPDSSYPLAEVRARLVLCSIFDGQHDRAELELLSFAKLHPDETGDLFGQSGVLAKLLAQQFSLARSWTFQEPRSGNVSQFGGSRERNQPVGKEHYVGDRVWEIKLPTTNMNIVNQRPNDLGPLSYFPIINENKLFLCDAYRVFAFDLATGKPAWGPDQKGAPEGKKIGGRGEIYNNSNSTFGFAILPGQSSGVPRYAMTVADGRLYARMGPPFLRKSRVESSVTSEIIGLDISDSEGSLVFQVTSDVLDPDADSPEATKWCFEGTPVVHDGRVYTTARRSTPEDEIVAVCFDDTGQLIWTRRVCVSLRNAPDHFNLVGHRLLTWGNGQLFVNTGTGAIAALNAEDGKINWVVTYQSNVEFTQDRLSDPKKIGMETCLYDHGVVYVAPSDSNDLFALEASTGHVIWHDDRFDRVLDLLAVVDNRLIVAGLKTVSIQARTGVPVWEAGQRDPDAWNYGRAWLTKSHLYRPTRTTIEKINLRTGVTMRVFDLKEDEGRRQEWGGNLLVSDGLMIVAQPNRVIAFDENVQDRNAKPVDSVGPDSKGEARKKLNQDGGESESDQSGSSRVDSPSDLNPSEQAQKAIESEDMATLWQIVRGNPGAPDRAEWLLKALDSHVPPRPWDAVAALNQEIRRNVPTKSYPSIRSSESEKVELRLARAAMIERLGRKQNSVGGLVNKSGHDPVERFAVKFTSPRRRNRFVGDRPISFSGDEDDCWVGANPFECSANLDWFELTKANLGSTFNLQLHKELPIRHKARVEHDAQKSDLTQSIFNKTAPWPVRQLWSRNLSNQGESPEVHLIRPTNSIKQRSASAKSMTFAAAPIMLLGQTDGLASIDPATGRELWKLKSGHTFTHFASGQGLVILATSTMLFAHDSRNGALIWRTRLRELRTLPLFDFREFEVLRDRLICVANQELVCFDLANGELIWRFDFAQHRWFSTNSKTLNQPRVWYCQGRKSLYRPKGSPVYFRIDIETGLPIDATSNVSTFPADVDLLTPISAAEWWVAGQSPLNRKTVWGMSSSGRKWEHELSGIAHGKPVFLQNNETLILIEDNVFAVCINRLTGRTIWKSALHTFPVDTPAKSTCLIGDRLIAVSDRSLYSLEAKQGTKVWKQPLQEGNWSITSHGNHIIAVDAGSKSSRVVVFEAQNGKPVQSIAVRGKLDVDDVHVTARAMFLHSTKAVECFVAVVE
jgi:outer membrane protein assembly factor BamB